MSKHTQRKLYSGWTKYKRSAETRGLDFKISFPVFQRIATQPCLYCGRPPCAPKYHHGLDRVRNEACYVEWNVVSCCSICNYMKGTLDLNDFLLQCEKIYKRSKQILAHRKTKEEEIFNPPSNPLEVTVVYVPATL